MGFLLDPWIISAGFCVLIHRCSNKKTIITETMTKWSDLPRDLAEEVFLKLPVTSLRGARSTCKKWNTLTKDESFTKLHLREAEAKKKEFEVVMMLEYKVYLMSVSLLYDPSIERIGKLVSLGDDADISKISHCDGLFLCITNDNDDNNNSRLVVWNPYCGQTRWIKPRDSYHVLDRYALGYEKKENNSLKVLRFMDNYNRSLKRGICEFEIYSLNSDSWKAAVDLTPDWYIESDQRGVSLKGDTYWFARVKFQRLGFLGARNDFILCFDFTDDKFGPRLPLPFSSCLGDTVALSSVRENQLAVLFQRGDTLKMKIWTSSKIEPNAVTWNKLFLALDMRPLAGFQFQGNAASFLVDEKKNVAVVLDKDNNIYCPTRNVAYVIGKEGYFETLDLGGSTNADCSPLVCSYVPSSVKIKQAGP